MRRDSLRIHGRTGYDASLSLSGFASDPAEVRFGRSGPESVEILKGAESALHRDDDGIHEIIGIEFFVSRKTDKKGCQVPGTLSPSISVSRLPAIALSTGTTATTATESTTAATGTLLHRFRFVDR